MLGLTNGPRSANIRKILSNQLISPATVAKLEFRLFRMLGAHITDGGGRNLAFRNAPNFLDVIFTIEIIAVDPSATFLEQLA